MKRYFTLKADKEYDDWQKSDKRIFKKINDLVDDIEKNGMLIGIGRPEQLKYFNEPTFSRRITHGDRLVYRPHEKDSLLIISCKGHYEDK